MAEHNLQRIVGLRGTEAQVEAYSASLHELAIAYATDTDAFGLLVNGIWKWFGSGGAGSGAGELIIADGITPPEPLTTEDETDFLYEG